MIYFQLHRTSACQYLFALTSVLCFQVSESQVMSQSKYRPPDCLFSGASGLNNSDVLVLLDTSGIASTADDLGGAHLGGGGQINSGSTSDGDGLGDRLGGEDAQGLAGVGLGRLVGGLAVLRVAFKQTKWNRYNVCDNRRRARWFPASKQVCTCVQARNTNLGSNGEGGGNIDSSVVGKSGVLETVGVHQVAGLLGELNSASSGGSLSLHHEGVVISDQVPNEGLGHLCCYNWTMKSV
jgi:hypothetical protein